MKTKTISINFCILVFMLLQAIISIVYPVYTDTNWVKDTWLGNDLVTLLLVCPLYGWSLSGKGRINTMFKLGSYGFVIYNYCFYLFGAQLNIMFLNYVLLVVLGLFAVISKIIDSHSISTFIAQFSPNKSYIYPGIVFCFIGIGLGTVWIILWLNYVLNGAELPVDEPSFRLVAALDLVIIVSSMLISGIGLIRKRQIGFVLGSIIGVQAFFYLTVLAVNAMIISVKSGMLSFELYIWTVLLIVEATGLGSLIFQKKLNDKELLSYENSSY